MMSNGNNLIPVESYIMRYYVRYSRLDQVIRHAFINSKANNINIFIDLYGIYKGMFSRNYISNITDYTSMTSLLINMCAHYRHYFKMIGVSCKIFLVSSFNIPELNCKFVADYNKTFKEKFKNKMIYNMVDQNIQLLEILCPYLPDIHFVKTDFESSVAMYGIITKERMTNDYPSLIISSDLYPVQLTTLFDDVAYLRPKKSMGEDTSDIICPRMHPDHENSFWRVICQEKEEFSINDSSVLISSRNYVLLAALNKFYARNFKAIINFTKANKIISSIVDGDTELSVDTLFYNYSDLVQGIPEQIIRSRYKALDIRYQYNFLNESVEPMLWTFDNLSDPEAINIINEAYFKNNPIDILNL